MRLLLLLTCCVYLTGCSTDSNPESQPSESSQSAETSAHSDATQRAEAAAGLETFEAMARELAASKTGDLDAINVGRERSISWFRPKQMVKLIQADVSDDEATAEYNVMVDGLSWHDVRLKETGYSAPCSVSGRSTLNFRRENAQWVFIGGESQQMFISVAAPESLNLRFDPQPVDEVTQEDFESNLIMPLNPAFTETTESWKQRMGLPL